MKKILLFCLVVIALSGCSINKEARQIKALEKCKYSVISADEISLAGTDVKKLINGGNINIGSLPGLAFGILSREIPFKARLNLKVNNPSGDAASINQFEYKILINSQELATGFVNQEVNIEPGQATVVPVDMEANLYPFISNSKVMKEITEFIQGGKNGGPEKKGILTLKIRPSIKVGGVLIKYPGFITINKEVSSKILL